MHEFIFTFGSGHYLDDIPLENAYVAISAPTRENARSIMFEKHGDKWAFCYETKEDAGVKEFNLVLFAQYDYKREQQ